MNAVRLCLLLYLLTPLALIANSAPLTPSVEVAPGAAQLNLYLGYLQHKRIGVFANQTSLVGKTHLVDTLRQRGVDIRVIFGPEHGFRGKASAGEKVGNAIDEKTGIPVVSLYGNKHKPTAEDLKDVDLLVFDIQDVGVRFYTFISSLQDFMEAAIENGKPLLLLDRPNPNGFYVDGPVMEKAYTSFVGRQPVPIVYGMTIGEYASMLIGEQWLSESANKAYQKFTESEKAKKDFLFKVIPCKNYTHRTLYPLPVRPSPNLPEMQSVYLYPSTCLFEGTVLSEGRGTARPFQIFGHPSLPHNLYAFTPSPNEGAKQSKHYNVTCYGWDLGGNVEEVLQKINGQVQLRWILEAYRQFPEKDSFFLLPRSGKMEESFFNKLSGNNQLWQQIRNGATEQEIRSSWAPELKKFKAIRKHYLIYPDFES